MRRRYLFTLLLLFPVFDLLVASTYSITGTAAVEYLRYLRDASVLIVALTAVLRREIPGSLRLPMALYALTVLTYLPVGIFHGVPTNVALGSAGTLLLPILLVSVGFFCIESERDLISAWTLLMVIGVLTILFGAWEIGHTDFWTDTVRYGDYMYEIKKSITGNEPTTGLPWNFFGYEDVRRAAGLLAAPLAQGSFLVVLLVTGFAYFRHRLLAVALAIVALYSMGIYQCGTRGAMTIGIIALTFYLFTSSTSGKAFTTNFVILIMLGAAVVVGLGETIVYSVNLADGSTLGHLVALEKNIADIGTVVAFGEGAGRQGAVAAQQDLEVVGGGEGALFSIAYQLGLPGALAFLWFYVRLFKGLYEARTEEQGPLREITLSLAALAIGFVVTFASSEHILTFSGMAAYWILAGGGVRVARRGFAPAAIPTCSITGSCGPLAATRAS